MPRLFHRPPKYGHHKSTNQAIVCHLGKIIFLGPYGSPKSHRKYVEFVEEWNVWRHQQVREQKKQATPIERVESAITPKYLRAKHRQGLVVTIDELIFVFRKHAREFYVKNGEVTREAELIEEITKLFGLKYGPMSVNEFGSVDLEEFRDSLVSDHDWTRKFINKQINRVRLMFKWGAMKEICLPRVPEQLYTLTGLAKGKTEARESKAVECVKEDYLEKTLPHLPPIIADMARFQLLTGARPGEVCSIRPCDIEREGDVWIYEPDSHKTEHHEKGRIVPIGPRAQQLLEPYLDRGSEDYCFSPRESVAAYRKRATTNRKTPLSCGNRPGTNKKAKPKVEPSEKYLVSSFRNAIRRACVKASVPTWTPHQLRHNAATKVRKEHGLEAAQVILGHSNANVTQVYAERDLAKAMQAAKELG